VTIDSIDINGCYDTYLVPVYIILNQFKLTQTKTETTEEQQEVKN